MPNESEYLIDVIMPKYEIHLLGGPSGAGKSRWLFDALLDWQDGLPVLGHKSYPVPWTYVASDRSLVSVHRTLRTMGIDPARLNIIPAWDEQLEINGILDAIDASKCEFAVIESFGSFVDPPCTGPQVKRFLTRVSANCRARKYTILGIMESPKLKPFEKYENPRQRISGAAAWSHFTETIMLVEPVNSKVPQDPYRVLSLCPRNGPGATVDLCFNKDGHLLPSKLAASMPR